MYIYIYIYIYTYIHTHIHTCIDTSLLRRSSPWGRKGPNIAGQKSTPQKSSWMLSGIIQWIFSGGFQWIVSEMFQRNFTVQLHVPKYCHLSSGLCIYIYIYIYIYMHIYIYIHAYTFSGKCPRDFRWHVPASARFRDFRRVISCNTHKNTTT